ncbi:MAG TPA: hypothetical protein VK034_03525 [Enhygromyxa sp.]|nr:hypothetical protein [Enhygromyxa sp.]
MTRRTRWDRAQALRDVLWADARAGHALTDAVLERFRTDRLRYSDILEWSLGADAETVDTARFSFAFPEHTRTRLEVARTIVAWADMVGPAAGRAARAAVRAARPAVVEQLMIGYADGAGAPARTKLYLQFRADAGPAALELAHAVLGTRQPTESDALPLHLLGLDVGATGLCGAKLYFVEAEHPARPGAWPRALTNALRIHRLRAPDDPGFSRASEIDFALADNQLSWAELRGWPAVQAAGSGPRRFDELARQFRLRPRRISLPLSGPAKLNIYYVLDEPEDEPGVSGTKP